MTSIFGSKFRNKRRLPTGKKTVLVAQPRKASVAGIDDPEPFFAEGDVVRVEVAGVVRNTGEKERIVTAGGVFEVVGGELGGVGEEGDFVFRGQRQVRAV